MPHRFRPSKTDGIQSIETLSRNAFRVLLHSEASDFKPPPRTLRCCSVFHGNGCHTHSRREGGARPRDHRSFASCAEDFHEPRPLPDRLGALLRAARQRDRTRSRRPIPNVCPSCSRGRPAAARPALSNTWPGVFGKPLVTVAAHEDMTAADLAGRYLLEPSGTVWHDGPLTLAVRLRRHLLSRRNRRGAAGHHRRHPSADRCAAHPAAGKAQRDRAGACRFPAHHFLQSRLPERGQGSEGIRPSSALSRSTSAIRRRRRRPPSSSARAAPTRISPRSWSPSRSARAICRGMASTKARPPGC